MKVRATVAIILAFLYTNTLTGQSQDIEGIVTLQDGRTPLADVLVYDEEHGLATYTSPDGSFSFNDLENGFYVIHLSLIGFENIVDSLHVTGEQVSTLHYNMVEALNILPGATVTDGTIIGGLTRLQQTPGSAYYLPARQLNQQRYTDINRALAVVPGLNIQEEDGFGLRPNIGMRGSGSERSSKITVMEDGILAAPAPYAASAAYYFPTMGRMQGIEILKGSSQIKYGPFTSGGAINLISTPIPEDMQGSAMISGGSYGTRTVHATVGNSGEHIGYMAEAFIYGSDGFKELSVGSTGFDKRDFVAKLRYQSKAGAKVYQSVTVKAGLMDEHSNETYLGITDVDFKANSLQRYAGSQLDNMLSEQEQLSIKHVALFRNQMTIQTTAYGQNFRRNWYKLDKVKYQGANAGIADILEDPETFDGQFSIIKGAPTSEDDALTVKANNRSYKSRGIQTKLGWKKETGSIQHLVEAGLRYHYDQMDRYQWVDEYGMADERMSLQNAGIPGTESNRIESAHAFAAWAQYQLTIQKLSLYPGMRFEHVDQQRVDYGKTDPDRTGIQMTTRSNSVSAILPGIGASYQLSTSSSLFTGIHKGFAPPGSNEGAKPEASWNYELGWRFANKGFFAEVIGFYSDYQNLLGSDLTAGGGAGSTDTYNGGSAFVFGSEIQIQYNVKPRRGNWYIPLAVGYTFTRGQFTNSFDSDFEGWGTVTDGDELPYLAPHRLSVQAGFVLNRFRTFLNVQYLDEMRTTAGAGPIPSNEKTDRYVNADLSATYTVIRGIDIFVSARNIFDNRYIVARRPAGVRPGLPRTFEAGVSANF